MPAENRGDVISYSLLPLCIYEAAHPLLSPIITRFLPIIPHRPHTPYKHTTYKPPTSQCFSSPAAFSSTLTMCRPHIKIFSDGCASRLDVACPSILLASNSDPTVFQMMNCLNRGAEIRLDTGLQCKWHSAAATAEAQRQEKRLANDELMKKERVLGTGEEVVRKD